MAKPDTPAAIVGAKAPGFTLPTVGGAQLSLSDLLGRKVVMFIWASW